MNNENYISEEAFEELVNGLEYIESFTLYGRKGLKYHIKRLQEENQQLKENNLAMQEEMARTWAELQQKDNIINKANKKIDNMFDMGDGNKVIDDLLEIQKILDNKGE